jgi:hypothetical protein
VNRRINRGDNRQSRAGNRIELELFKLLPLNPVFVFYHKKNGTCIKAPTSLSLGTDQRIGKKVEVPKKKKKNIYQLLDTSFLCVLPKELFDWPVQIQ